MVFTSVMPRWATNVMFPLELCPVPVFKTEAFWSGHLCSPMETGCVGRGRGVNLQPALALNTAHISCSGDAVGTKRWSRLVCSPQSSCESENITEVFLFHSMATVCEIL